MAQSTVSIVLGSMGNLAVQETKFLCTVTLEVEFLKDELVRLQAYLKDADNKWRSGNARVVVLVNQIRAAAYEAQNVIEAADHMEKRNRLKKGFMGAISRYARLPFDLAAIHKIGGEIQRVKRRLKEISEFADRLKIDVDTSDVLVDEYPQDCGLMHQNIGDDIVMVGFQDEYKEIADKIVSEGEMLSVVSIVAMDGAGKTTLARKVYTSPIVKQHFGAVAWVTVSQKFTGVDLLKDVMKQIIGDKDESVDQMQEFEVRKKIRDFLFNKRYLLVLDDVRKEDTWDQINRTIKVFPDENNGSRVLLTTRNRKVATHIQMPTHVHVLKELDEAKSWELFSSKALPSYIRSVIGDVGEFEQLGRLLAGKCDGLPLALTVLGGYLSKNLEKKAWSDVLLGWPPTRDTQMMRDILARSYNDLPNQYLKLCLLYLACFPEDYEIEVSDLIELWIAENFIPHRPKHIQEETARMYVAELAQRSFIQVVQRSKAHGWIEKIRIHDILRDWCIEEATQDGFLHVNNRATGQTGESSYDAVSSYRISLQNSSHQILQERLNLRSLIGFGLPSISRARLRFLRVLHIENSSLKDFCMVIDGCIHLRCLRLRSCEDVKLPSSIGKLLYLQTIDLRRNNMMTRRSVKLPVLPKSLWDIPTLRHVYLSDDFLPPALSVQPKDLRTLSIECCNIGIGRFIGQMTQLTTLSLTSCESPKMIMDIFANMPHLVDLSLGLDQGGHVQYGRPNIFQQDPMPILEKLPCLVVLKMWGGIHGSMSCSAQGFPQLQELELDGFSVNMLRMEEGTMQKLSYLSIREFTDTTRAPDWLLHLQSLKSVQIITKKRLSIGDDDTLKELQRKGCQVHAEGYYDRYHMVAS